MDRRRWLPLALVVVLVLAGGGLQWWRTHPEPYFAGGAGMRFDPTPVDRAIVVQVYPDVDHDEPITVRFTSIRARFRENTADATVDLFVCTPPSGADSLPDLGLGFSDKRVAEECATSEPALGQEVTFGDDTHRALYYRVAPTQPGRVRMNGIVIRYDIGWQRAEDRIGDSLVLRPR